MFKGPPLFRLAVYIQISNNGFTLIERGIKLLTFEEEKYLLWIFVVASVLNTSFETALATETDVSK